MKSQRFSLTPDLIMLLRHSYVNTRLSGCEYGAAEIDGKRPYGNSDVEGDLCELLGIDGLDVHGDPHEVNRRKVRSIHAQTPIALQIVLCTGSFEPGIYEASPYGINWHRVSSVEDQS